MSRSGSAGPSSRNSTSLPANPKKQPKTSYKPLRSRSPGRPLGAAAERARRLVVDLEVPRQLGAAGEPEGAGEPALPGGPGHLDRVVVEPAGVDDLGDGRVELLQQGAAQSGRAAWRERAGRRGVGG